MLTNLFHQAPKPPHRYYLYLGNYMPLYLSRPDHRLYRWIIEKITKMACLRVVNAAWLRFSLLHFQKDTPVKQNGLSFKDSPFFIIVTRSAIAFTCSPSAEGWCSCHQWSSAVPYSDLRKRGHPTGHHNAIGPVPESY